MISTRPYLIRAINEWACENGLTPHLLVNANDEGVIVPVQHVQDGQIILNISPSAVEGIELGNEWIFFSARFSGQAMNIEVPVNSVLAIYARENGQGMVFEPEESSEPPEEPPPDPIKPEGRPSLKIVK